MIWEERTTREKTLILVAIVLISIFTLWQFMVKPVFRYHQKAVAQLSRAERDLQIVRASLSQMAIRPGATGPAFDRTVLVKTAREQGMALSRVQPEGKRALSVWFDAVPTQQFYMFLTDLVLKNGAVIERVQIDNTDLQNINAQVSFYGGN